MNKYVKNVLFGIIAWLVPFVAAFFFYSSDGKPTIDQFLLKSILMVIGAICNTVLIFFYFKKIDKYFLREGIILGFSWYVINILLDILVLVPMSGMSIPLYFTQIGISYLVMTVMCISVGLCLAYKKNH